MNFSPPTNVCKSRSQVRAHSDRGEWIKMKTTTYTYEQMVQKAINCLSKAKTAHMDVIGIGD